MDDENLDEVSTTPKKTGKKVRKSEVDLSDGKKYDLQAAHRKAVMVMVGIFLAILVLMILLQNHVEFASTGGM